MPLAERICLGLPNPALPCKWVMKATMSRARRAPTSADKDVFLFHSKGARTACWFPKQSPKVAILVQEDQDNGHARMEVIIEPTSASWTEVFVGEDHL